MRWFYPLQSGIVLHVKACPHYETRLMRIEGKPGWIPLAHVRTQSGLMRVQRTWKVWATSRWLKRTTTRVPVARLLVYSVLQRSKNVLGARARSAPFLTQFQPTSNPHTYVGWLNPGSTRFRKKWVECGLAISEFNLGWTRGFAR